MKNNSTSHKALGHCVTQLELPEDDDDSSWDIDKVLKKLKEARANLRAAQKKKHKDNYDAGLCQALEKHEEMIKEMDDPKKAKKAAAAVESIIRKHHTLEL